MRRFDDVNDLSLEVLGRRLGRLMKRAGIAGRLADEVVEGDAVRGDDVVVGIHGTLDHVVCNRAHSSLEG